MLLTTLSSSQKYTTKQEASNHLAAISQLHWQPKDVGGMGNMKLSLKIWAPGLLIALINKTQSIQKVRQVSSPLRSISQTMCRVGFST